MYPRTTDYEYFKQRFVEKSIVGLCRSDPDTFARLIYPRHYNWRLIFRDFMTGNPYMDGDFRDHRRRHGAANESPVYTDWFMSGGRAPWIPFEYHRAQMVNSRWVYPPAGYQLRGVGWLP